MFKAGRDTHAAGRVASSVEKRRRTRTRSWIDLSDIAAAASCMPWFSACSISCTIFRIACGVHLEGNPRRDGAQRPGFSGAETIALFDRAWGRPRQTIELKDSQPAVRYYVSITCGLSITFGIDKPSTPALT
jgi:hypothetical protein